MSTLAIYNGVTFSNVLTRTFRQEAVYDELSHTDLLFSRFTVALEGIVHIDLGAPQVIFATQAQNAVEAEKRIRERLMAPRQTFIMQVGGATLLAAGPNTLYTDMNNGPKPISFEILHVIGDNVFRCLFTIEVSILECGSVSQTTGRVLNNRWSMEDEVDENWFVTRRINGQLRVSDTSVSPQSFRGMVIPGLARGFKMNSMRFATTPDGLILNYSVEHRSQHASPPIPGLTWRATHSEAIGSEDNPQVAYSELNITLTGQPGADKQQLLQACALVAQQKLRLAQNNDPDNNLFFPTINVIDHLNEPIVEVQVRRKSIANGENNVEAFFKTIAEQWGKPLSQAGYDPDVNPAPPADGTVVSTVAEHFAAYLQSPCGDEHAFPTAGTYAVPSEAPSYTPKGPKPQITTMADPITVTDDKFSTKHRQAIYTHYRISSRYIVNKRKVQLPIAQRSNGVAPGDPTCDVIPLALGTATRVVTIEGERIGQWPEVLSSEDYTDEAGGNATLLDYFVDPKPPQPTADQRTQLYSIDAQYVYALARVPEPGSSLRAGNLPWARNGSLASVGSSAFQSPANTSQTPA